MRPLKGLGDTGSDDRELEMICAQSQERSKAKSSTPSHPLVIVQSRLSVNEKGSA